MTAALSSQSGHQLKRMVDRIPPHDRDDAFAPLAEAGRGHHCIDFPKNGSGIFFAG
jgi:hypothetical protein